MYAVAFGLLEMQLLCLHVSEHRDLSIVKPIWNQIFEESEQFHSKIIRTRDVLFAVTREETDTQTTADVIVSRVVPLGKRFYPSESAFPLRRSFNILSKNKQSDWYGRIRCNATREIPTCPQRGTTIRVGSKDVGAMWRTVCRSVGCAA